MYFPKAVTLEISALQYFPWVIGEARRAIEKGELMPGRFIRVRNMAEQIEDQGDTLAVAAAMQILGASYVETLDTKGEFDDAINEYEIALQLNPDAAPQAGFATIHGHTEQVASHNHAQLPPSDYHVSALSLSDWSQRYRHQRHVRSP